VAASSDAEPVEGNQQEAEVIEPFDFGHLVAIGAISTPLDHQTAFMNTSSLDDFVSSTVPAPTTVPATAPAPQSQTILPVIGPVGDVPPTAPDVPLAASPEPVPWDTAQAAVAPTTGPITPANVYTNPPPSTEGAAPRGALELLQQENVVHQLGALYLTNKRVILLAPTVVRSAFIRDIDAVGTMTSRASAWHVVFGLLLLAAAGAFFYASTAQQQLRESFGWAYSVNPLFLSLLFALVGAFLFARYFLWVKRSLFVSVKGRPLITVSMTDWNTNRLAGMDAFVNAFFQIKDMISGDLVERPQQQ
ncbi:MAG TPA: hypothetical protein VM409_00825, partial [Chloroflexia bacterium]|nr:hypothetical protein [Chloroflexia bacterium]